MKKLGFGCMRFPTLENGSVDIEQVKKMFDIFMEKGFTCYDTSYVYHGGESEKVLKEALVSRYERDKFTITTKLPMFMVSNKEDMERIFNEQLERLGTDYVDYYWLHAMTKELYDSVGNIGFEFLKELKENGKIKHIGFSFHDEPYVLKKMLNEHPETEFVQLQLNYIDWESNFVKAKECYDICTKHNIKVIVMEPVKGGGLVNLPEDAEKILKAYDKDSSNASWAIRWCATLPNVYMVLSGMSNIEQVEDNTSYMENFKPLTDTELSIVDKVAKIINDKIFYNEENLDNLEIDSKYKDAVINYVKLYNEHYKMDCYTNMFVYYNNLIKIYPKASQCLEHINDENIKNIIKKVADAFER